MPATGASRCAARSALLCGLFAGLAWASGSHSPAVGTPAPDFSARSYVTNDKTRLSDQHGKIVILTFWATWCGPCRKELPNLEAIQEKVGNDHLVVLAVNFRDTDETLRMLRRNVTQATWKMTLLEDSHGIIAGKYGIDSIPHLFLIGRDGTILATHSGFGDGSIDEMLPEINAALAGKAIPGS